VSRVVWYLNLNVGATFLPRVNTGGKAIVNKYREGKLKQALLLRL